MAKKVVPITNAGYTENGEMCFCVHRKQGDMIWVGQEMETPCGPKRITHFSYNYTGEILYANFYHIGIEGNIGMGGIEIDNVKITNP